MSTSWYPDWLVLNLFYGGLRNECKYELDLASGGSFTSSEVPKVGELLDIIHANHEASRTDEGG